MYRVTSDDDINGCKQEDCKSRASAIRLLAKWVQKNVKQCPSNQVRYTLYQL